MLPVVSDFSDRLLEANIKWVERDSDNAEAHNTLGWAYYRLNQLEDAATSFNNALEKDATLFSAYRGLGHIHYEFGEYEEAIENYSKWLDYDPNNFSVYSSLGWAYYNDKQYSDALDTFMYALNLNPDSPSANQGAGYVYNELGDYASAVKYYRNWANLSSGEFQPFSKLGWALFELGDYSDAVDAFEQVVSIDPENILGYKGLAYSHKQLQNDARAYEYQIRWSELAASDPEPHNQLGWSLYGQQNFEAAIQAFSTALALNPEYYSALSGRGQAYFYSSENGCEQAIPDFEAALRIRPAETRVAELLSRCEE